MADKEQKPVDSVEDAELLAIFDEPSVEEVGTETDPDESLLAIFDAEDKPPVEEEGDTFGKDVAELIPEPVMAAGKVGLKKFMESPVGKGVAWAGEKVERYAAAPTRAAIAEGDLGAFAEQFGEDPEKAPTGEDIAEQAGVSPYWKGTVGLGIDVLADPTNLIPVGAIAKGTAKGVRTAVKGALKGTAKATTKIARFALRSSAAAADAIAGTKGLRNAVDIGEGVVVDTAQYLKKIFDPKVAPDYDDLLRIAKKNNIDPDLLPSSVEFGKESVISRGERKIAEGIGGEKLLQKHTKATQSINKAMDWLVEKIGGGKVLSPKEAGIAMKEGFNRAVDEIFKLNENTYASVYKNRPNLHVSEARLAKLSEKLDAIKAKVEQVMDTSPKSSVQYRQARLTRDWLNKVVDSGGNYEKLYNQMKSIGEAGFKKQTVLGAVSPDTRALREMYFEISDSLLDAAGDLRPRVEGTNKVLKDFFTDRSYISKIMDKSKAPEEIFNSIVKNGNTNQLQALKNILSPEDFQKVKGAFVNSMIKRNVDDFISFKQLNNRMNRAEDALSIMLSPQEIADIKDLIRLGDRIDLPVLSTSGTGASNAFKLTKLEEVMLDKAFVEKLKNIARSKGVPSKIIEQGTKSTRGMSKLMRSIEKYSKGAAKKTAIVAPPRLFSREDLERRLEQ